VRPLLRFCRLRDDIDFCRDLIGLRGRRTVRFCPFAADDFRDLVLVVPLARKRRPPPFRDLVSDFLSGCRLSAPFKRAVARLTVFRTGRSLLAAFPARAPTTPPTTAPTGPAMLPIAAPVTAPAVSFGIGGTWISSDGRELFSFSGFELSGIDVNSCISSISYKDSSDDKADVALAKVKLP
jgi:hypothetical protein